MDQNIFGDIEIKNCTCGGEPVRGIELVQKKGDFGYLYEIECTKCHKKIKGENDDKIAAKENTIRIWNEINATNEEEKPIMKDIQRKRGNKYILPRDIYHQTLWMIRGYNRMVEEAKAILEESSNTLDGQPKSTKISDPVYMKALRREENMVKIKIIESELEKVPEEYRTGVWNNVQFGKGFPNNADRTTYSRHKSKFLYEVARRTFLWGKN